MLSKADDYPVHQTPEPIAFAGTDRNFYDRYFFNGYAQAPGDRAFFAVAFGIYPHLNIADAAFVVVRNGVEVALHASRDRGRPTNGSENPRTVSGDCGAASPDASGQASATSDVIIPSFVERRRMRPRVAGRLVVIDPELRMLFIDHARELVH